MSRISKAWLAFQGLKSLWRSQINPKIKLRIYNAAVIPVLTYACETWCLKAVDLKQFCTFQKKTLRRVLQISYLDRVRNDDILNQYQQIKVTDVIERRVWQYLGHVLRMPKSRYPATSFLMEAPPSWQRPKGGVKLTFERQIKKKCEELIMKPLNLSRKRYDNEWKTFITTMAADCAQWKTIIREANAQ